MEQLFIFSVSHFCSFMDKVRWVVKLNEIKMAQKLHMQYSFSSLLFDSVQLIFIDALHHFNRIHSFRIRMLTYCNVPR